MRALFLNWRDTKHPKAGGAEYVTQVLAEGLVKKGWQVDWFTALAPGLSPEETVGGVHVIRRGGPLTVQRAARRWYATQPRYDVVVDQSHGWPFFAFRWTQVPTLFYINEVTGEIARYMLPWPLSSLFQSLEPWIISRYAHIPAVAISQSTKTELRQLGHVAPISVINLSCDVPAVKKLPDLSSKEHDLTILFAARLVPLKRPDHAIRMLAEVRKAEPSAKLWILGKGPADYQQYLNQLVQKLHLEDGVKFLGFVTPAEKIDLLARAHFVTYTSIKEGWGLVVPEANAVGTVGVTYNTAGVRDSNRHNETGLLSPHNTPVSLAETIVTLYNDKRKYQQLRHQAWMHVKTLTWEAVNDTFQHAIKAAIKDYEPTKG